jgi:hypothetical protein
MCWPYALHWELLSSVWVGWGDEAGQFQIWNFSNVKSSYVQLAQVAVEPDPVLGCSWDLGAELAKWVIQDKPDSQG